MTDLYYEAHITIEPVFDDRLETFKKIASAYRFRVAELLMQKRSSDTPERSQYDSFCTGRSNDYTDLHDRMALMMIELKAENFHVWRYKIEDTILDSRFSDPLKMIDKKDEPAHA